jgi:hypothetical protein
VETLPALAPDLSEIIMGALAWPIGIGVAVASFRRSRHLSGYPIWRCVVTAVLACMFWPLWFVAWAVNHEQVAREWRDHHTPDGSSRGRSRPGGEATSSQRAPLATPGRVPGRPGSP